MKTTFVNESAPRKKSVLPKGWNQLRIDSVEEKTSKKGNCMLEIWLHNGSNEYISCYCLLEQGKQWLFLQLVKACEFAIDAEGNFEFNPEDFVNKFVYGYIENEQNEFINRRGEMQSTEQSKITNFSKENPNKPKANVVSNPDANKYDNKPFAGEEENLEMF